MKQKYQIGDKVYVLNGKIFHKEIRGIAALDRYLGDDAKQTTTFVYSFTTKKLDVKEWFWFEEEKLYSTKEELLDTLSNSIV